MALFTMIVILALCWALLLLPYLIWLRHTTHFNSQRLYLYLAIFTGMFLTAWWMMAGTAAASVIMAPVLIDGLKNTDAIAIPQLLSPSWTQALKAIYFTVTALLIVRLLYQVVHLFLMARSYAILRSGSRRIVETIDLHTPYSFFNLIFFSREAAIEPQDKEVILQHENIHTSELHSFDIILCEILLVFTWFIPVIRVYKYLFNELHEYIADEKVTRAIPLRQYGDLLIRQSLGEGRYLTHNFAFGTLKQRILKMKQKRSPGVHRFAVVMPVLLGAVLINGLSLLKIIPPAEHANNDLTENTYQIYLTPQPGFTVVADDAKIISQPVAPTFPGGNDKLVDYFRQHLDLNQVKGSMAGQYLMKIYFDEKGQVRNMTMLKPAPDEVTKALQHIVDQMPAWTAPQVNGRPVTSDIIIPVFIK